MSHFLWGAIASVVAVVAILFGRKKHADSVRIEDKFERLQRAFVLQQERDKESKQAYEKIIRDADVDALRRMLNNGDN